MPPNGPALAAQVPRVPEGPPGIARSVASVLGLRVVALALTFAASVVTARLLGPQLRGELAVMIAIPSLVAALGLMGGDTANLYFAGRSRGAHAAVVGFALAHAAVIALVVALPLALLGLAWPAARLGLPAGSFVLAVALTPILTLVLLLGAAESGRHRAARVALLTTAATAMWLLGTLAAAAVGVRDVSSLFALFLAAQAALGIALLALGWPRHGEGTSLAARAYLRYAAGANISGIALLVMLRLDVPLIQVFAGPVEVGLYAVALPISESLLLLSTAIGLVLLPSIATGAADRERTIVITQLASYGAVAVALCLAVAAPFLVPVVFGPEFGASVPILWALLPGAVLFTAGRTLHTYLVATSLRAATGGALAALAIVVVLSLALIPRYGALGAAMASSAGYAGFALVNASTFARLGGGRWHRPFHPPRPGLVRALLGRWQRTAP